MNGKSTRGDEPKAAATGTDVAPPASRRRDPCFPSSVLRDTSLGVLLTTPGGEALRFNESALDLLTVLAGRTVEEPAGDITEIDPRLGAALHNGRGELSVRLKDGSQRFLAFSAETLSGASERLIWLRDATDEVTERERLRRAEQLGFSGKMASRLSHKINNPLGSMLAGLQALERVSSLSPDDLQVVRLLLGEVRYMTEMIDSILDSTRTAVASPRRVSMESLIGNCLDRLTAEAASKSVSLSRPEGPANIRVTVDERSMSRALRNIVLNALEACQVGGAVELGWREVGDRERNATFPGFKSGVVGIFCTDTGKGLPEELTVSSMFRPFVTTKHSAVGLGLAVAQEIVENHGGVILVSGNPPMGTTVEAFLPVVPPSLCWEAEVRVGSHGEVACGRRCVTCDVKASGPMQFCWVVRGRRHRSERGTWLEECLACPVFESRNLTPYLHSRCR